VDVACSEVVTFNDLVGQNRDVEKNGGKCIRSEWRTRS